MRKQRDYAHQPLVMMLDKEFIEEAIKLVNDGICVTLPVGGQSMLPFIVGGQESVILQKPTQVKIGNIVLAWVDNTRFVIHRIVRISGEEVTLMGDGNLTVTEHCLVGDIKAIATHVVDTNGRKHDLYDWKWNLAAKVWYWLHPVRRYLLAIYRRL